jgi:exodeoxyribonuclease-5
VRGECYFINDGSDVMLTEVHRSAAENPIVRISLDIREGAAEARHLRRQSGAVLLRPGDRLMCLKNNDDEGLLKGGV